jgi:hypothetical protein
MIHFNNTSSYYFKVIIMLSNFGKLQPNKLCKLLFSSSTFQLSGSYSLDHSVARNFCNCSPFEHEFLCNILKLISHSWLRHYVISWKMAGSIPVVVIALLNSPCTTYFQPHYGPRIDLASNRNQCQEYSLGVKNGRSVRTRTSVPFLR